MREDVRVTDTGNVRDLGKVKGQTDATGWNEVRRRRTEQSSNRTDVAKNYQLFEKKMNRISYFFTNFPDNFRAKHMLKAFLKYGEFEEVVIPAKRDKRGKRFGFARAVGVADPEKFAVILDNIIIGSEKILVNLPRFDRQWKSRSVGDKTIARAAAATAAAAENNSQKWPNPNPPLPFVHTTHKATYAEKLCPKPASHTNQKPEKQNTIEPKYHKPVNLPNPSIPNPNQIKQPPLNLN